MTLFTNSPFEKMMIQKPEYQKRDKSPPGDIPLALIRFPLEFSKCQHCILDFSNVIQCHSFDSLTDQQIGRASCRERV